MATQKNKNQKSDFKSPSQKCPPEFLGNMIPAFPASAGNTKSTVPRSARIRKSARTNLPARGSFLAFPAAPGNMISAFPRNARPGQFSPRSQERPGPRFSRSRICPGQFFCLYPEFAQIRPVLNSSCWTRTRWLQGLQTRLWTRFRHPDPFRFLDPFYEQAMKLTSNDLSLDRVDGPGFV